MPQPRPDPLRVVAPVGEEPLGAARGLDEVTHGLELRRLSPLPGREMDRQRQPVPVAGDVELRRYAAPAASERLGLWRRVRVPLFRAPEATREARMEVPSIIHVE